MLYRKTWRGLLCSLVVVLAILASCAQTGLPFVHPLFTDNMVLQRNIKAPVFGWTTPGAKVTVSLHGKTATAVSGANGYWLAKIGPFTAGGPYNLTISGPQTVTIKNVLLGDVWLCSGQSNMEMGIGLVNNAQQEIANANNPNIRLFFVPKTIAYSPQKTVDASWKVCTPETISADGWSGFSAAAYFFGRHLQQTQHVPIGLIDSSWGGTVAEAWVSGKSLRTLPDFQQAVPDMENEAAENEVTPMTDEERIARWYAKKDPGTAGNWQAPDYDDSAWQTASLPGGFDGYVPNFDGVVWYRTAFTLPAAWQGKDLTLSLGPIDDMDTTFVNGVRVGGTNGWNVERKYTIPATALHSGRNVIAVRVFDLAGPGGFCGNPQQLFVRAAGETPISLAVNWRYRTTTDLSQMMPLPLCFQSNANIVTVLNNAMIAPLAPFGLKGAIWYQGEANVGRAEQYRTLLATLIRDWRMQFDRELPFFIVQLAGYGYDQAQPVECPWADLRESQYLVMKDVPKTGLAVAIDIGDRGDIHPKNKQEVGRRLGLAAQAIAYGQKDVIYSGPEYRSMKIEGKTIRLSFNHVHGGLVAKDGDKLVGFAIAGVDKKFVWADAVIQGNTVIVSSPRVENPVAVRYAWGNTPACNLYNKADLPAIPFRTDLSVR